MIGPGRFLELRVLWMRTAPGGSIGRSVARTASILSRESNLYQSAEFAMRTEGLER